MRHIITISVFAWRNINSLEMRQKFYMRLTQRISALFQESGLIMIIFTRDLHRRLQNKISLDFDSHRQSKVTFK